MRGFIIVFWALLLLPLAANAEQKMPEQKMPEQKMIYYTTGTGFFVSNDGYILTNNHVIENCGKISIHGDNMSSAAELVARDERHDLALLKSTFTSPSMAYFNSMKQPLKAGEPVVIVGYPKDSWRGHNPVVNSSYIIDTKGPTGEGQWLQFQDSVQNGNSGGPLMDSSGNVVGVIAAKAELHIKNQTVDGRETVKKSDIAISLPVVKNFMASNNVAYQTMDSGIYLSPDDVTKRTRSFIVNVHCRVAGQ